MALDPTPDASLFSLTDKLNTHSATLRRLESLGIQINAHTNSNSNGAMTQGQGAEDTPSRLQFPRRLVPEGTSVWDTVTWETRDALIVDKDGNTVFEQKNVRVPSTWSQTAVNVVASKYFRLINGVRETGVDQMIQRVSATITEWGIRDGYFDTATAAVFAAELQYLLLHQMASFNSPVWFNIGVPGVEQAASACYILSVEDSMEGILEWYRQEGMIFSRGAGAGVNISSLRGKGERISKGGSSSGPMSFSRAADASAFSIKSGGSTRRSARMLVMNVDHPDIEDFIHAKEREEAKARVLQAAGYDDSLDGEIYATVAHQNCNMSVAVTDAFLEAVEQDQLWELRYVTTGEVAQRLPARDLLRQMAQATWSCGDPGIQYNDTMNRWHTCPQSGRIEATNPCCLTGDTLLHTSVGVMRFDELYLLYEKQAELPWVASANPDTGEVFWQCVNRVWVAGQTDTIVVIATTNGVRVTATPEHRFLLADGRYVEAQHLEDGDILAGYTSPQRLFYTLLASDTVAAHQIITLTQPQTVFDMEMESTPNFAVTDGEDHSIIVHNSEYLFLNDTACFTPETRISTPKGLRTVLELYEAQCSGNSVIVTTDIHTEYDHRRITSHRPSFVTQIGERPVVRMTLKDGRSIRVTPDHRFLTVDGWKRVDQMVCGVDRICIRESGNPIEFSSPEEEKIRWQMLGWLSGDGVFSKDSVVLCFGPDDEKLAEQMVHDFNKLIEEAERVVGDGKFVRTCHISRQQNGVLQIGSRSSSLVKYLEERYGMKQGTAIYKDVPSSIYSIAPDLQAAYIQGLFSSDGTIRNASGVEPEVMLASSSPEMLMSIQLILGDMGITSRISWHHPTGRKNPQGQLHIMNQQMRKYLALIGMPLSEKKQKKTTEILSQPFNGAHHHPRPVTIYSIEEDGTSMVYDITEPFTHSLIAEGMIAHNCNLSSLNLLTFLRDDDTFDTDLFRHAVDIMITAKEILVSRASYPTEAITRNSHRYRTLGIGYANLGALLMAQGLPYDSEAGRAYAASITALMTGEAYAQSARLAQVQGPFEGYAANQEAMLAVIGQHDAARQTLQRSLIGNAARAAWEEAQSLGARYGYRNAQVSLLAPTGTIAIMMDCATTGVEPDVALVNYKALVGGGTIKKVNEVVPRALRHLGYGDVAIQRAQAYIEAHGTLEGCPAIHEPHLPVFDCAFPTTPEGRSIHYEGHIRMVAAVQPFLSGSASKTINMPNSSTVEDIEAAYLLGWKLGCKSLAVYRDGCKATQVLTTHATTTPVPGPAAVPFRRRLPDERAALTHKFQVGDQEGYLTVGLYDDGTPGEIFIHMSKEGSTISGLIDAFATSISMALQYGVPLQALCDKFQHSRFAPSGFTHHPQIRIATSVTDYIFRYLALKFLDPVPATESVSDPVPGAGAVAETGSTAAGDYGAGVCTQCGGLLRVTGNCSVCTSCGMSMGCS